MKAALFTGVGEPLSVETVDLLPLGPTDVRVQVGASGVCHSDLAVIDGDRPLSAPAVLGHEAAGRVVEVGSQVSQVAVGDRVVTSFIPACGRCFWCQHGQSNLCSRAFDVADTPRVRAGETTIAAFLGVGSFAEVMTLDEASTVAVRTDLPDEQLALLGCGVTTGVCSVLETAQVRAGQSVAVVGCGGVGQAVIQGAAIAGAARIIALDPVAFKRDAALANGATDVIDPSAGITQAAIAELTDGRGADYVFEATGSTKVAQDAFELVRRGGTLVILGMPRFDAKLTLPANPLFATGRRVLASKFGDAQVRRDFQRLIDLTETGRLDLKNMVSRRVTLPEINDAVQAMREGKVIRSVIA
jgi:S-(hydroxymethyl)glutathione dehydrogenase/alcohol dehydrogenase